MVDPLQITAYSTTSRPVRLFSFGGGVQSTAVMVMQARGMLARPYDVFIFANVGADSENPATIEYVETAIKPYAEAHGIQLAEVQKTFGGEPETLLEYIYRTPSSVPIPMYLQSGAPGNRTCTEQFKILVVDQWARRHKYTHAEIGLGISMDEWSRMRDEQWHASTKYKMQRRREYPLIEARMNRAACQRLTADAGLPPAPKSSCWFCPFHSARDWENLKRELPVLFRDAVRLEHLANAKRALLGKDTMYLHQSRRPLAQAVGDQMVLPGMDEDPCESGYCMV